MTDLIEWLRERYDKDEQVARACATWQASNDGHWTHNGHGRVGVGPQGYYLAAETTPEMAEHMARHDPASVLADIAAKRAVLDRWEQLQADVRQARWDGDEDAAPAATEYAYEQVARILATAYADRPGYREEWRP